MSLEASTAIKLVIGTGDRLQWAMRAWKEVAPDLDIRPVDVGQDAHYQFDIQNLVNSLDSLDPAHNLTAFVAWGSQFLNFRRLELMGEIKVRGIKMPPLLSRRAILADDVVIGENCSVGAGSIIGQGCKIGYNTVVGAGCLLSADVQIASSVWIADGVQIGGACRIGSHATLGQGVIVREGISVGRQSSLEIPGQRNSDVPDKTLFSSRFSGAVTIVDY